MFIETGAQRTLKLRRSEILGFTKRAHCAPLKLRSPPVSTSYKHLTDAKDFAQFAETELMMPMLVLAGEKASGNFLIEQGSLVDSNVEGVVINNSGHWLLEEAPHQVIPQLVAFINKSE